MVDCCLRCWLLAEIMSAMVMMSQKVRHRAVWSESLLKMARALLFCAPAVLNIGAGEPVIK